jgi:hypothetical protein
MTPPQGLLTAVSKDLRPVRPALLPSWRAFAIFPIALLAVLGVFYFIGFHQKPAILGPVLTWGASFAQLMFGVLLVWVAARESTPGKRLPSAMVWVAIGLACLVVIAVTLWTFEVRPIVIPARFSAWRAGYACGKNETIAAMMLLVVICLLLARRPLSARPALVGALYGAAAGVVVNAGWRLSCSVSTPSHSLLAHGSPILIAALAGAVFVKLMVGLAWRRGKA